MIEQRFSKHKKPYREYSYTIISDNKKSPGQGISISQLEDCVKDAINFSTIYETPSILKLKFRPTYHDTYFNMSIPILPIAAKLYLDGHGYDFGAFESIFNGDLQPLKDKLKENKIEFGKKEKEDYSAAIIDFVKRELLCNYIMYIDPKDPSTADRAEFIRRMLPEVNFNALEETRKKKLEEYIISVDRKYKLSGYREEGEYDCVDDLSHQLQNLDPEKRINYLIAVLHGKSHLLTTDRLGFENIYKSRTLSDSSAAWFSDMIEMDYMRYFSQYCETKKRIPPKKDQSQPGDDDNK